MIFQLKEGCGNHTTDDGKKLKAGEYVESDTDLEKRFRGKFVRIRTQEDIMELPNKADLLGEDSISEDSDSDVVDEVDDSTTSEESVDDDDVDEVNDDEEDEVNDDEEDEELVKVKNPKTLGKKVTSKFPVAKDLGVRVYDAGNGWYLAYDPEDKTLLNPKGKKLQKSAMKKLLDSYVDED